MGDGTAADDAAPIPGDRPSWRWADLLLALPVVVLAIGALQHRWIADDGLINVRVAENLASGRGYAFASGFRAEAATSPAWAGALALVHLVTRLPTDAVAVWLGFATTLLGLVLLLATLRRRHVRQGSPGVLVPAGLVAYACYRYAWDFTTGGLENGFVASWFGIVAWTWRGPAATGRRRVSWHAALLGLGPLIRPDLALVSAVLLLSYLWPLPPRRTILRVVLAAGALPVAFQVFRMGYFGLLAPNTGLAKEGTTPRLDQGLRYLGACLTEGGGGLLVLTTLLAVGAVALHRVDGSLRLHRPPRTDRLLPTFAVAGALHLLYVVAVGGDFMLGRLALPGALLLAVAASGLHLPAPPPAGATRVRPILVALAGVVALGAALAAPSRRTGWLTDEHAFYRREAGVDHPTRSTDYRGSFVAERLDQALGEAPAGSLVYLVASDPNPMIVPLAPAWAARFDHVVVGDSLGVPGLLVDRDDPVLDPIGLADPLASHQRLLERGRPGHEKQLAPAWYVAWFGDPSAPLDPRLDPDDVDAARRALACGDLAEAVAAATDDLDLGRFLDNLRGAPGLTAFRFDPRPQVAERELCG